MDFKDKLDFLMKLTNTSNSLLARHIDMDPSFISRLRSGSRKPSKNEDYIKPIAEFLSERCIEEYQREGLFDAINAGASQRTNKPAEIAVLISSWFKNEVSTNERNIAEFMKNIDNFSFKRLAADQDVIKDITSEVMRPGTYIGTKGKRKAVLNFLICLAKDEVPKEILIYSDEDMSWLTANMDFTAKWAALFAEAINKGHKVKIVHTINRSLEEMLAAIREWLPFYMTGKIEPLYYPKTVDSAFKRSMLIAPGKMALISNSVSSSSDTSVNMLISDVETVNAFEIEFKEFLKQCKPLMKIYNPISTPEYFDSLIDFEEKNGDILLSSRVLSYHTFPQFLLERILREMNHPNRADTLAFHRTRLNRLSHTLENNNITDIIVLPDLEDVQNKRVPIGFSTMFSEKEIPYDQYTLKAHLENIISMLKHYPKYNVVLLENAENDLSIYIKQRVGLFVLKYNIPSITFAITEPAMTSAFWNYLNLLIKKAAPEKSDKDVVINEISEYIKKLTIN